MIGCPLSYEVVTYQKNSNSIEPCTFELTLSTVQTPAMPCINLGIAKHANLRMVYNGNGNTGGLEREKMQEKM